MSTQSIRDQISEILYGNEHTKTEFMVKMPDSYVAMELSIDAILALFREMQEKVIADAAMHDICSGCAYEVREATNRLLDKLGGEK